MHFTRSMLALLESIMHKSRVLVCDNLFCNVLKLKIVSYILQHFWALIDILGRITPWYIYSSCRYWIDLSVKRLIDFA